MSTTPATDQLLSAFAPWLAYDLSGNLATYLRALGSMFDAVAFIVSDQGDPDDGAAYVPGWSNLLDPDNCPTALLPFVSQFNGTGVQPGTPDAEARAIIKAESGFARGSLASLQSAVERAQSTPDQTKYAIQERTGLVGPDAYHFLVVIDTTSLATQGDLTQLTANVNSVKPAGLQFTVVPYNAPLLSQYTRLLSAVTPPISAAQLSDVT